MFSEPCLHCKNNIPHTHPAYESAPFMWEAQEEEPKEPEPDMVNQPPHYKHGMECIDEMIQLFGREATMNFCLLNAWKYRKRAIHKNGQEDMDKSDWYIAKYVELKKEGVMDGSK
jgi:hypothetical protein